MDLEEGLLTRPEGLDDVDIDVDVRNLSYTVAATSRKGLPRTVLFGVSCHFPARKMSAIMGASGSGKTSLLTLVRGLTCPGSKIDGEVLIAGARVEAEAMRRIASVVPQQDVFLSALTPREMLRFTAELRLGKRVPKDDMDERVQNTLRTLRLQACADTAIGDDLQGLRGISGGERRRLSVGLAVIGGLPRLLLCDEPTSGLDSMAAASLIDILDHIAGQGVTVLCAIHQPSYALFRKFDTLLLLEAGRTMFFGNIAGDSGVESYFSRNGSPTPEHTNPAHHYITQIQQRKDHWGQFWLEQGASQAAPSSPSRSPRKQEQQQQQQQQKPHLFERGTELGLLEQTEILTRRTLLENFKNRKKFFRGVMSRLPASMMVGFFFFQIAKRPTQASIFPLKGLLFVATQNPVIETFYAGATTFQSTKGLLKREYYDGLYQVIPYYLAYYIGFLAMQIPWTLVWVLPMYLLVGLPLDLQRLLIFMLTTFLVILMACAAGSCVGTRTRDAEGNRAVLMPMLIPMVLFSGYVIPLGQIATVWQPIFYLSPVQWAMSVLERNHYFNLNFEDCDASIPPSVRHCFATGQELLETVSHPLAKMLGVSGMLLICATYIGVFLAANVRTIRSCVLDGRI